MENIDVVAKWFINELHPDTLKLQKLLYFAQGISYCYYDEALFEDEMEAWVHGPVVRKIYNQYKDYGYNPINTNFDCNINNSNVLKVLEYVKNYYGKYDGKYLEELTHEQEPWLYARRGLDPDERIEKIIPKEIISQYFISLMCQPMDEVW